MILGNNIILITNDETMINLVSSELIHLRNIDSILLRTFDNAMNTIENDKPQTIIINCKNTLEEPACLDLIKEIKSKTEVPIILIVNVYNKIFVNNAFKAGITDCTAIQYSNAEILMRTIWSLQKNDLLTAQKKYQILLEQLNVLDPVSGFYTAKSLPKAFGNEFEYLKEAGKTGVLMAVTLNKENDIQIKKDLLMESLKRNIRRTDTGGKGKKNIFYALLANTNLTGAIIVWDRLNSTIGLDSTILGSICDIEGKTFEEAEEVVLKGLEEAGETSHLISIEKVAGENEDWLEEVGDKKTGKALKFFKQGYDRKVKEFIQPLFETFESEAKALVRESEVKQKVEANTAEVTLKCEKQESSLKLTHNGLSNIKIEIVHAGLDSPENTIKNYSINTFTDKELQRALQKFLDEYRSCL